MADYKVYKRRWVVLILFVFCSASNGMQWTQFTIISNIAIKYYGVSNDWIDWTSLIYMATYIPMIIPGSWFLERTGLRITALVGMIGTCIGSWVKVYSVEPSNFNIAFTGQTIVGVSQVFIISLPARLAAVWFGADQVSTACSLGVIGNQLGVAIGFVGPPIIVENSDDMKRISHDLLYMFYLTGIFTTLLSVLMLLFFEDKPPTPPVPAELFGEIVKDPFMTSLKNLATNKDYVLLFISYGMNVGVYYAISTLLNPLVVSQFPGHEVDAGRIGLCIVVAGMLGSITAGILLDATQKFKETCLFFYAFTAISMWIFTYTLNTPYIVVVYVTASVLGFFMTGYLPVGFEFGVELTFPISEGTTCGLLNASAKIFGTSITMVYSKLFFTYGDQPANITLCIILMIGTFITSFITSEVQPLV